MNKEVLCLKMLYKYFYLCIYLILNSFVICHSARILAWFPVCSISHQIVFRPLTQELAKRGHELIIVTPDPAFRKGQAPDNITEIDVHNITYAFRDDFVSKIVGCNTVELLILTWDLTRNIFEEQVKVMELKGILKSDQHFDLILVEALVRPAIVISHLLRAPLILISSFGSMVPMIEVMGASSHLFLYPDTTRQKFGDLTIIEKLEVLYEEFLLRSARNDAEEKENAMLKKLFGEKTPTLETLSYNVDLLMLNVEAIWDGNRPVPPGMIFVGGLHLIPEKPLPTDLKSYLDDSKNGVIYFSLGTNVEPSALPAEKVQVFINVFSKLPYDVLCKWDTEEMSNKPKNVKISKWLPQADLLRHPKIKLFINQGGLQSTDEAITAGVPLIAFPIFGDQFYNANKYVEHNIGISLDIFEITEEVLESSIRNVIKDESYRQNIRKLRDVMRDKSQTSLERAVWWAEHVIRHKGGKHLHSPSANISWPQYLMLDLVCTILGITFVLLVLLGSIVYLIVKKVLRLKKAKRD